MMSEEEFGMGARQPQMTSTIALTRLGHSLGNGACRQTKQARNRIDIGARLGKNNYSQSKGEK
jgi:hypothetical protein